MSDPMYKIVFRGELVAGIEREAAEANLKARFRYSDAALARLFSSKALVLKGDLDQATALKYRQALEKAGIVVEVLPMVEAAPAPPPEAVPESAAPAASEAVVAAPPVPVSTPAPARETPPPAEPGPVEAETPVVPETEEMYSSAQDEISPAEPMAEPEDEPAFAAGTTEVPGYAGPLTEGIFQSMKQTRPWVRLISILLFIGAALGLLGSVAPLLAGMPEVPGAPPYMLIVLFQALFCLFYLIPAWFLFKYGSAIGSLINGGGLVELESALVSQKSFWKFSGIMALIGIVLGILGVAAAIAIPMLMR